MAHAPDADRDAHGHGTCPIGCQHRGHATTTQTVTDTQYCTQDTVVSAAAEHRPHSDERRVRVRLLGRVRLVRGTVGFACMNQTYLNFHMTYDLWVCLCAQIRTRYTITMDPWYGTVLRSPIAAQRSELLKRQSE